MFLIKFLLRQVADGVLDAMFQEQQSKRFKNWPILKYSRLVLRVTWVFVAIFIVLIFLADAFFGGSLVFIPFFIPLLSHFGF